jgi:NSS family neurotransmitter:Na+ symporter
MSGGRVWGALFFLFLSFAAMSTVIAVFENIIGFWNDLWDIERKKASLANIFIVIIGSMPCVLGFNLWARFQPLGKGSTILDLEDFIVSQNLLPLGAATLALFCSLKYGWGWEGFTSEANTGKGLKFPTRCRWYFRYLLPLLILTVMIFGYKQLFK